MLRQRVLTAATLAPLAIAGVLWLPTLAVAAVWALLGVVGAWEWAQLAGYRDRAARVIYALVLAIALALIWALAGTREWMLVLAALALPWWGAALWLVVRYRGVDTPPARALAVVAGVLTLLPPLAAVAWLHGLPGNGPVHVLLLFALVWTADIGAFFAGRRFGRRKLAPHVSPGKTLEGLWGALAATALVALAAHPWLEVADLLSWLLLALAVVLVSVLGDLSESLFKRAAGVKDSGNFFPGHGGVLDRLDSLTAALPLYACGLALLGVGA